MLRWPNWSQKRAVRAFERRAVYRCPVARPEDNFTCRATGIPGPCAGCPGGDRHVGDPYARLNWAHRSSMAGKEVTRKCLCMDGQAVMILCGLYAVSAECQQCRARASWYACRAGTGCSIVAGRPVGQRLDRFRAPPSASLSDAGSSVIRMRLWLRSRSPGVTHYCSPNLSACP